MITLSIYKNEKTNNYKGIISQKIFNGTVYIIQSLDTLNDVMVGLFSRLVNGSLVRYTTTSYQLIGFTLQSQEEFSSLDELYSAYPEYCI